MEEVKEQNQQKEESKGSKVWKVIIDFLKSLWVKIFLPAIKEMISVGVNKTTQHILYHTPIDGMSTSGPRPADTPWRPSDRPVQNRANCWIEREPNRYGLNQIAASNRRTLEAVYGKMQAKLNDPSSGGFVSVGEMYTFAGCAASYSDYSDGWTTLNGCAIQFDPVSGYYVLHMTETHKI